MRQLFRSRRLCFKMTGLRFSLSLSLAHLAEGEVDAPAAEHWMLALGKRRHAMKGQPRRPAPDHDVAMHQAIAHGLVRSLQPAPQEDRGQAERHRDDRLIVVL